MVSFTEYLKDKYSADFTKATQHPFLVAAGDGMITEDALIAWLRQDYLYAYVGYVKFASLLLSRIPIADSPPTSTSSPRLLAMHQAVPLLTFSLSNVHREANFFIQTAKEHGLELHPNGVMPETKAGGLLGPYEEVTRSYIDFLWATAAGGSVEDGLVLLWAMEEAYLTAWSHAKKHLPATPPQNPKEEALRKFVDNWTCEEFVGFVKDCTKVVDGLEIDPKSETGRRAEEVFKRTIWLEQRFWPDVSGVSRSA